MNNSFSVYSDPRSTKSIAVQQYDYVNKTPDLNNHDLHRQFDERSEQPRRSTKRLVKVSNICNIYYIKCYIHNIQKKITLLIVHFIYLIDNKWSGIRKN